MDEIDQLLIMTANEIDFSQLTPKTLEKLALSEDLFIATLALSELAIKDKLAAALIANRILSESLGDHFLQASALETLFRVEPQQAFDSIKVQVADCDAYLLNTIMELMIEEESYVRSQASLGLTKVIKERLTMLGDEVRFIEPQVLAQFQKIYG